MTSEQPECNTVETSHMLSLRDPYTYLCHGVFRLGQVHNLTHIRTLIDSGLEPQVKNAFNT